jgi:hypothetical protein
MMQRAAAVNGLTPDQLSDLRWLLPEHRPGYARMFHQLCAMTVIGQGRWGESDFIFGRSGDTIDPTMPHSAVFAHGVIIADGMRQTITVHHEEHGQVEVQFETVLYGNGGPASPASRYSYSEWLPGDRSPALGAPVREISVNALETHTAYVLALCAEEQKLWLYDTGEQVNRLIPHTGLYHELMRCLGEKRPDIALHPQRLFKDNGRYSDQDLLRAVHAYNAGRWQLPFAPIPTPGAGKETFFSRVFRSR